MRALEFFAGIGGFACASAGRIETVAIDIDQSAGQVYRSNFNSRYLNKEIESISLEELRSYKANMWWLSPPCQPYCQRGQHRDLHDTRARSLLHLLELIEPLKPEVIALENVPGFATSQAYSRLRDALDRCHYSVAQRVICPTELGWPNRRARFYMLASQEPLHDWQPLCQRQSLLGELLQDVVLEPAERESLKVSDEVVARYANAMDRVCREKADAVTACFGSSYGKSLLHAGSYLEEPDGMRRFHPREVARIMGFPREFMLPNSLTYRQAWKLLGNSLSIPVVEYVISHLRL